ncbi:MAG: CHAT domain-containing protein [Rhodocyclaceae bacterium]|nr:CHAT domain-containing protein [Rhodocyclaceae bacterium]
MMRRTLLAFALALAASLPAAAQSDRSQAGFADRASAEEFRRVRNAITPALDRGDFLQAEQYARRMVELAAQGGARPQAIAANRYGQVLRQIGRSSAAESFLRQAEPLLSAEFGPNSPGAMRNLLALGSVLTEIGKLQDGDAVLAEALRRQLTRDSNEADLVAVYTRLANNRRQQGMREEPEKLLRDAIARLPEGRGAVADKRLAQAHLELAHLLGDTHQYAAAAQEARQAWRLSAKHLGPRHPLSAYAAGTLGMQLVLLGQYDEAERLLLDARTVIENALGPGSSRLTHIDRGLGYLYLRTDRWPQAELHLQRAIEAGRAADTLPALAKAARSYARALWQRGRPDDALRQYLLALDAIDRGFARTQGLPEAARNAFVAQYAHYYRETVQLLIQMHNRQPQAGYDRQALEVVSRTQSRIFSELLRRADVTRYGGDPAFVALRGQQQTLQQALEQLRRRRAEAGVHERAELSDENAEAPEEADARPAARAGAGLRALADVYRDSQRQLAGIEAHLRRDYPRYMELTQPAPVGVDLLQARLLRPGETLLCYALLPQALLLFEIRHDSFRLHVTPLEKGAIGKLVGRVRGALDATAGNVEAVSNLAPADLARLYDLLLGPVRQALIPGSRVLVVGDGPLYTLPFEMLVADWNAAAAADFAAARRQGTALHAEYGKLHYAGADNSFAYWPSLAALASARQFPKPPPAWSRQFVSFADPAFAAAAPATPAAGAAMAPVLRSLRASSIAKIPGLPEAADEARAIAAILGKDSDLYLRERAQEYTVKHLDLSATRFVHFATHGLLSGDYLQLADDGAAPDLAADDASDADADSGTAAHDGQPALLMALAGDLHGEDGLLTMGEVISAVDLNAELVALSACNTAGEARVGINGEGFAGMTRAFMYAGARGLLVTHWSVESLSAQFVMTDTFRRLHDGAQAQDALAAARKNLRATEFSAGGRKLSRAHPYFWAPFVFVGD